MQVIRALLAVKAKAAGCCAALKNHQRSHLPTNFMGIFVQWALTIQWKGALPLCGAAKHIMGSR
jgi:hypothetical protein